MKCSTKVCHLGVAQVFTKATLDTVAYMKLPDGCGALSGNCVRLDKGLCGLKQSGVLWNDLLVVKVVTVWHGAAQA